jgi:hypothetical protein
MHFVLVQKGKKHPEPCNDTSTYFSKHISDIIRYSFTTQACIFFSETEGVGLYWIYAAYY